MLVFSYPSNFLLILLDLRLHASLCSMDTAEQITSIEETPRMLFSRQSAAKALDISVRMIDYAIASGLLETRHLNSRILIPSGSLAKFAASDRVIPKAPTCYQESAAG